ncbi:AbaSI family restriction endonuclease [Aliiroseovarius sp. F47248L]|uniref:AbaSI family restriction endonuclease n=1 Tax=Aliiroseovarius sp. F47248L TaxID=2926420 RepID=UPI001FF2A104|nr:hypothetical protein [Aliiroseovarius sp. F47248L]MCK0140021.1 hypothetical protein [Aliiroseovarius sp. F47248L]
MRKDEFILRSLSKIKHKKWELFVISRIVHGLLLDNEDVEFICQQLVRRPDGGRALTDMYFPQFGVFLEIDEPQHATEEHTANDRHRTDDIVVAANLIEKRIPVLESDGVTEKSLASVAKEADDFINEIRLLKRDALANDTFEPWDFEDRYDLNQHVERGFLSISTNPVFRYQHHALRCFGYTKGVFQRGAWTLASDPSRCVWFPRLYETETWDNELSPDGMQIVERKKDGSGGHAKIVYDEKWKSRIVFARYSDNLGAVLYRFVGEFKHDPALSDEYKRVFSRVTDRVDTISANGNS